MNDDDRDAILLRRSRFIGLALAGVASMGCDEPQPEQPLSPAVHMEPEPEEVEALQASRPEAEAEAESPVAEPTQAEELTEAQRRKRRAERGSSMSTPSAQPLVCLWFKP